MAILGGLDIHRRQIAYDWIDTHTGESCRGQLSPATGLELRELLRAGTLPSPGCQPPTSPTPAPRSADAVPWSASAPAGTSASTPSCSTTACLSAPSC
jgi:hypothetical protein